MPWARGWNAAAEPGLVESPRIQGVAAQTPRGSLWDATSTKSASVRRAASAIDRFSASNTSAAHATSGGDHGSAEQVVPSAGQIRG